MLAGVVLTIMLTMAGMARLGVSQGHDPSMLLVAMIGPIVFVLGLALVSIGLLSGFAYNKSRSTGSVKRIPDVQIQAVYGFNSIGHMVFTELDLCLPKGKLFVRVGLPNGTSEELRCSWPVLCQCGEGMRGIATVQGDWLGAFEAYPPEYYAGR